MSTQQIISSLICALSFKAIKHPPFKEKKSLSQIYPNQIHFVIILIQNHFRPFQTLIIHAIASPKTTCYFFFHCLTMATKTDNIEEEEISKMEQGHPTSNKSETDQLSILCSSTSVVTTVQKVSHEQIRHL